MPLAELKNVVCFPCETPEGRTLCAKILDNYMNVTPFPERDGDPIKKVGKPKKINTYENDDN